MPAAIVESGPANGASQNGHHNHLDAKTLGLDPNFTTSYPTQSLSFLRSLQGAGLGSDAASEPAQAKLKLNIVIVGAGLGGLATSIALARRGHSVVVLEQAPKLGEVGAGIQIPPNSGRLLRRWGVFAKAEKLFAEPSCINFRRWQDGSLIGYTDLDEFGTWFGAPYCVAHRAHLHEALHARALELGVELRLNSRVAAYRPDDAQVELANGEVVRGDLVVAADGIKSVARDTLQAAQAEEPTFTGFAAYRATVDAEKIAADPEIAWILQKPSLNIWIGENRHVMSYTISAGKSFNMVLSHVDLSDPSTWKAETAVEDVNREFAGWDPCLTKIISLITSCIKWPLRSGRKLKSWVSPNSRLVILGDAAHAMVPYMSQGAAMAVEDGAALAVALSQAEALKDLPLVLGQFEQERIKRSGAMQEASMVNGLIWHFPDGPEQEARDEAMRAEVERRPFTRSANQWSDPVTQWWAYGYDAEDAMQRRFKGTGLARI
ncbi:hypothetical protein PpBr36_00009 [Pyricularia pennisetigena]|uniref:hypothetical protein n=1 Tax=Pyricularia pennisetigena TaxID=1578925 RepID=UPI00115254EF|nr:hypothetical protein PpBr36_00009 [Pyricularia pennisetigena]TLS29318.1 hypothetical protein PpBr36_00009 [Pyricularia pennisetigena]